MATITVVVLADAYGQHRRGETLQVEEKELARVGAAVLRKVSGEEHGRHLEKAARAAELIQVEVMHAYGEHPLGSVIQLPRAEVERVSSTQSMDGRSPRDVPRQYQALVPLSLRVPAPDPVEDPEKAALKRQIEELQRAVKRDEEDLIQMDREARQAAKERDALHDRVNDLERELARAASDTEQAQVAAEAELDKLREDLRAAKEAPSSLPTSPVE